MKKVLIYSAVLIALYLVISNSVIYKSLLEWTSATFRKFYRPLVKGENAST